MKTRFFVIRMNLLPIFFYCINATAIGQTTTVNITTVPEKQYPLELWVYNLDSDKYVFKNNLSLNHKGRAEFKIPHSPNLYKIALGEKGIEFINDESTHIEIEIDFRANTFPPIKVKGSKATNHYKDYLLNVIALQKKYLYPLESKMKAALKSKDVKRIDAVEKEHKKNLEIFASTLYTQITEMGSSLAVFAIIRTLDFNRYLKYIEILEKSFSNERPSSSFTIKLREMIEDAKTIQIGGNAPEFELGQYHNNQIQKLSGFEGGIVLLDFWASWCLPCIKENIEFKEIHAKFKGKGFNIWGLNMDKKEKIWKGSIKKYGLPWVHSRLEDDTIEKMYKVVALPTNFLLDENGKIIAKNVTAVELSKILSNRYQ